MNRMKNCITSALTAAILTISFTDFTAAVEPQTVTLQWEPYYIIIESHTFNMRCETEIRRSQLC